MKKKLLAGVSITDISPKEGIGLAGYPHYPRYNTGIHDPLYASCIFLDDGNIKLAIVCMDIVAYTKANTKSIRDKVSLETEIPAKNIMISCSHTHSGPRVPGTFDLEKELKPDINYVDELEKKIVNLIIEAYSNTFEARIGTDKGYCGKEEGVGGNRRNPEGLSDPQVWTIGLQDRKGNWKACFVKYSLHPTVIHEDNTLVTADYPGYIRKYLSGTKPEAIFLFAQGTSGNQSSRYFRSGQTFEEAQRIGYAIGKEADKVLDSMKLKSNVFLEVKSAETDIALKKLPTREKAEEEVLKTKNKLEKLKKEKASYMEIQNANLKNLGAEYILSFILLKDRGVDVELATSELPAEVQIIGIGESRIVGVQGEIFVEFGLKIQKESPFKNTFIVTITNGSLPGYLCTREAYMQGGYETGASMLTGNSGDAIVKTALKLLKETI